VQMSIRWSAKCRCKVYVSCGGDRLGGFFGLSDQSSRSDSDLLNYRFHNTLLVYVTETADSMVSQSCSAGLKYLRQSLLIEKLSPFY
jgi:hypothetical protein